MADSNAGAPKPSSSVKLVLLGEAAVGKVCGPDSPNQLHCEQVAGQANFVILDSLLSSFDSSTTTFKRTRSRRLEVGSQLLDYKETDTDGL